MNLTRLKHLEANRLRELVATNLERILGTGASLRADPSCGEECLLADGPGDRRTLVSFDMHDANQALLRGLIALDHLALNDGEEGEAPELLILSPEPPAGKCLLSRLRGFTWRAFEVVQVDDRLGLLLEDPPSAPATRPGTLQRESSPTEGGKDGLTPEEDAFFQHL